MIKRTFLILGLLPIFTTSFTSAQEPTRPSVLEGGVEIVNAREARDMALPYQQYPAIKFMRSDELFLRYPDRSKMPSGLYLVDTELIPRQLHEILTRNGGLALQPDGSVINSQGRRVVLMLWYKLAQVTNKQGSFPFPLEYGTAWMSSSDDEGFCRSLKVSVGADAWGPIIAPGIRPHTNVQQVETYAQAADQPSNNVCNNNSSCYSHAEKDWGCFWPAHGNGTHWGWADIKDGSINWPLTF